MDRNRRTDYGAGYVFVSCEKIGSDIDKREQAEKEKNLRRLEEDINKLGAFWRQCKAKRERPDSD